MSNPLKKAPIGVFDSGLGGLSHLRKLQQTFPEQEWIYVADLQHLPYGNKSVEDIQAYSLSIARFLMEQGCRHMIIACHTASSAAADYLRSVLPADITIQDVISPVIHHLSTHCTGKTVGLIGTELTIASHVYSLCLETAQTAVSLRPLATPLLASYIEERYPHYGDCSEVLEQYFSDPQLQHIEALVLSCTHYSWIKEQISDYFGHQVEIIDSADLICRSVQPPEVVASNVAKPRNRFFMTQPSATFSAAVKNVFAEEPTFISLTNNAAG